MSKKNKVSTGISKILVKIMAGILATLMIFSVGLTLIYCIKSM